MSALDLTAEVRRAVISTQIVLMNLSQDKKARNIWWANVHINVCARLQLLLVIC